MLNLNIKVYKYLQSIPKGKVVTYGQIAEDLGNKNLSRAIGNILHINPDPIKYPCYKVVNHKGELSQNFGDGGITIQKERLEKDGIIVNNYKVNLKIYQYKKTLNNYTIENYLKK
jgi:O-6-methylguanine DNA methyltransferase